jgi:hypothetical protein
MCEVCVVEWIVRWLFGAVGHEFEP